MRRKTILLVKWLAVLGLVFSLTPFSFTQLPGKDRVVRPIDDSSRVTLQGNVRPMFRPENDQGPVEGSFKLENISLMFKPTQSQQADLTALLAEQQDRSSPNYHQWLTPEQYADRFGLSQNDINQVVAWLEAQGFTVTQTARSRTWVSFSGTAAQVEAAFQTEIHNFSLHGETYYANAMEPSVPSALADMVLGIHGLDNYPLKPRSVVRRVKSSLNPRFTSGVTENTFVTPGDFATIYDVLPLWQASPAIDGTGQKIAVMGQTDLYGGGSDITAFRTASGLPANPPTVVLVPGASDPGVVSGDIDEASLDVEWSGAVAKNATIIFVNGGTNGVFDALQYSIDNPDVTAPVISISYGDCEANWGTANLNTLASLGQQANSQGQTIVAAAGDNGAADCDAPPTPTSIVTVATHGLAVDAPASTPYVTGMGGSEFNEGAGNYWNAATTATGDILTSALSYIPEVVWNDTSSTNGLDAGGGGASAFFSKPNWQTGNGVPNDNARDVPDLSLNASPVHDGYLYCVQGSCVNGFRLVSSNPDLNNTLTVAGGSSFGAPTFAGIVALINQQYVNTPPGQGNVNRFLYPMAASTPAAFHDITVGNNIVPCEVVSTDTGCPASGEMGFSAHIGYDQASGLGSIDAFNLVTAWDSSTSGNLPAPTLSAPANGAIAVVVSPNFTWTQVIGNAGYRIMIATSPADLLTNPATSTCSACTVVGTTSTNSNSYTPPSALAVGAYYWQVQAIEPSSSSGTAAWSSAFSFTTAGGTLAAPTLTAPANGATGVSTTPTFSWTTVSGNAGYRILIATTQAPIGATGISTTPTLPTSPAVGICGACTIGTTTTAASYTPPAASALTGGTTYYWEVQALAPSGSGQNAAWSNVFSFTAGVPDFSLSASPSSLTIAAGSSGTSTLTLTPINNFSGSVTFSCSVASTLAGVTCSVGALSSNNTAAVTITASSSASTFPAPQKNLPFTGWPLAALAAACLMLMVLIILRRGYSQSWPWSPCVRQVVLGVLLACLLAVMLSCGGGSGGGGGGGSTPESGTVTVQGTGPNTSHSVSISVTVS
jgi:hypothetical protein